jgi:hypothetical protein
MMITVRGRSLAVVQRARLLRSRLHVAILPNNENSPVVVMVKLPLDAILLLLLAHVQDDLRPIGDVVL